jgi:hypothetical protein
MTDVFDRIKAANPVPDPDRYYESVTGDGPQLLGSIRDRRNHMTEDQITRLETPQDPPSQSGFRGWKVAVTAAAAVVALVVGFVAVGGGDDDTATSLVDDRPLEKQFEEAIRANDGTRIEALVDAGLDVNAQLNTPTPFSAIALIAATGNHDLVPVVVAAGFDLEAQRFGRPPLIAAAEAGDLELISALVEAGADLEGVDDTQQNTAVQYAFYFGRVEAARLLISLGADLDYVDITGDNTADMAIQGGSSEAIALAEELGLTPTSDE